MPRPLLARRLRRAIPYPTLLAALVFSRTTFAQTPSQQAPRAVTLTGDSLSIAVGERVILPLTGVTRIITDDEDVAQPFFLNGKPVIQGLATGVTVVEIYQNNDSPRVITVQVGGATTSPGLPTPANPPTVPPFVDTPPPTPDNTVTPPITAPPAATDLTPQPDPNEQTAIKPALSQLNVTLNAVAAPNDASQIQFAITYSNPGDAASQNAIVRFPLDERVSYVTGSASSGGTYDPVRRTIVWNLGTIPANFREGRLTLRVQPIERKSFAFDSEATIEDGTSGPVASAQVRYSTSTTPLLTVFAIPDRFLVGRNGPTPTDVRGTELQSAVDRLYQMRVVSGYPGNLYYPNASTRRAEYAVMTLNGLNLRDLRDVTEVKFVLGRRSTVSLFIQDSKGHRVADLIRNSNFESGEHTVRWNGSSASGFVPAGRYTYVCTARDANNPRSEPTTLRGFLNVVPQSPLETDDTPSFVDVKASDWYARYIAVAEKQGLVFGFPDKTFRPQQAITRVEATAIVVRALGLSDLAKEWADKDVGFRDYAKIPAWARGDVNVATTIAKTIAGKPMVRGTSDNTFEPEKDLRRDQAALLVQRLIDRETTRRVTISGAIVPGAVVTINSRQIEADGNGKFAFSMDVNTAVLTTVAVVDTRGSH